MNKYSDQAIIDSWKLNIEPWITAIRDEEIESRLLVTNKAIIDAVFGIKVKSALDVGCGEGWLVRALEGNSISSLGVDAVPEFIMSAQSEGGGRFKILSYDELSHEVLREKFDVVICNFSLLGKESVNSLFERVPSLLNTGGRFIIQTIHPAFSCGDAAYADGWREGTWDGFSDKFTNPAPWYFRTLETWENLFLNNGFSISEILEPLSLKTQKPASIIFIGAKAS